MDYYKMQDSSQDMTDFQYRLIMNMSPQQRFIMGLQMADKGMKLVRSGIAAEKRNLSEEEMRKEIIRRFRKYDPSISWLDTMGIL